MRLKRLFNRPGAQAPRAGKSSKAPSLVPQEKPTARMSTVCATYGSDAIASMIAPSAMPSSMGTNSSTPDGEGDGSDSSSDTEDSLKSFVQEYRNEFGRRMVGDAPRPPKDRDPVRRALQRRPGLNFSADAVQHAARVWDRDMMVFLLDKQGPKVHLTCGVIEAAVRNPWFGEEVISLLLERGAVIKITNSIAVAAFENKRCGRNILLQLLSNPGVSVASGGVGLIAALFDIEVVKLLLNKSDIRVTDKALVAAARSDDWKVFELLFAQTTNIRCVEDIAVAAAGNQKAGWQIFRLLVDCGPEILASEIVWKAAAGHEKYGRKMIGKLFDQQGKVLDSEETIVTAARNTGTGQFIIAFLLTHATSSQLVLTDKIILAAVDNKPHATQLIDLFLEKSKNEVQLTDRIVQSFTEPPAKEIPWINSVRFDVCDAIFYILKGKHQDRVSFTAEALGGIMRRGTYELICQLLDTLGEKISIPEKMIEAAAESNQGYDVAKIVQRLFRHTPSVKVTERAVILAAKRDFGGKRLLESFFEHDRGLQVPPEAIEAAANSRFWASDLVGILLDQAPTVRITEAAIAAAGQHMYDTSTFDLFLSKCKGEMRLSLQGLPYMLYDIRTAPTINFIKRALCEPHGATIIGPPIEEAVQLDDPEIVAYMLKNQGKKPRALSIKAAENIAGNKFAGQAITQILLAYQIRIEVTESVVRSAAGIFDQGYEIMDLLLRDTEMVMVSPTGVEAITALLPAEMLRLLFETRREVTVTTRMIEAAAKNGRDALDVLVQVLGEFPSITDGILQAAASNPHSLRWIHENYGGAVEVTQRAVEIAASHSTTALQVMLERWGGQVHITTKVMEAIASTNWVCDTVVMLFDMRPNEINLGEDFWVVLARGEYAWRAEEALGQLLMFCDCIRITGDLVDAASKHGKSLLKALLHNHKARVTASGVQAMAKSFDLETFALLVDQHGHYISLTERTMECAAGNEEYGWGIVELLIRTREESRSWCVERVIEAAARNRRSGKDIIELLLCEVPESQFATVGILMAAAQNADKRMGGEIIELLLSQREDEAVVIPAVVDVAIANSVQDDIICELREFINR